MELSVVRGVEGLEGVLGLCPCSLLGRKILKLFLLRLSAMASELPSTQLDTSGTV
jgi:hypothetical protein